MCTSCKNVFDRAEHLSKRVYSRQYAANVLFGGKMSREFKKQMKRDIARIVAYAHIAEGYAILNASSAAGNSSN